MQAGLPVIIQYAERLTAVTELEGSNGISVIGAIMKINLWIHVSSQEKSLVSCFPLKTNRCLCKRWYCHRKPQGRLFLVFFGVNIGYSVC